MESCNLLWERNLVVLARDSGSAFFLERSGVTLRNNVAVVPEGTKQNNAGRANYFLLMEENGASNPGVDNIEPIRVHNNTFIDMKQTNYASENNPPQFSSDAAGYFSNVTIENNVHHKPLSSITLTTFAPIDTTTRMPNFSTKYNGYLVNFLDVDYTLTSDWTAGGGTFTVPYSSFTTEKTDGSDSGGTTDQAYWQSVTSTSHNIRADAPNNGRTMHSSADFSVSFDASVITFTNTSDETIPSGAKLQIFLDRFDKLGSFVDPTTDPDIPIGRPLAGSSAIGTATTGLRSITKDFFLKDRWEMPSKGAIEP